jgi:V/A-type H+-transporting ATPase subunit C
VITELLRYGGSAAKVRSLYGRRLTQEDFKTLTNMKSVSDVTVFLKSHPGWRDSLAALDPMNVHRNQLEDALKHGMLREHFRIHKFMFSSGAELYQQPVWRAEQDEILSCYANISAGKPDGYSPILHTDFRKHSRIDFSALAGCRDWASLLSSVSKTDFYPILRNLRIPETGLPDIASVEWVMQSYVFSRLFSAAKNRASGKTRKMLESLAGSQVDLINIGRIIRIRNFFPDAWQDYAHLLLPFSGKIPLSFLRELHDASDEERASNLLRQTPYKKLFEKTKFRYIEEYYNNYMYEFSMRALRANTPSALSVIAYLNLKEIELQNIIKTAECIRYGKTPESAGVFLPGITA